MAKTQSSSTPREAAGMLNVSYPTIKQWILAGKIRRPLRRVGITGSRVGASKPFLKREEEAAPVRSRERYRKVSGRNQLVGKVVDLRWWG